MGYDPPASAAAPGSCIRQGSARAAGGCPPEARLLSARLRYAAAGRCRHRLPWSREVISNVHRASCEATCLRIVVVETGQVVCRCHMSFMQVRRQNRHLLSGQPCSRGKHSKRGALNPEMYPPRTWQWTSCTPMRSRLMQKRRDPSSAGAVRMSPPFRGLPCSAPAAPRASGRPPLRRRRSSSQTSNCSASRETQTASGGGGSADLEGAAVAPAGSTVTTVVPGCLRMCSSQLPATWDTNRVWAKRRRHPQVARPWV